MAVYFTCVNVYVSLLLFQLAPPSELVFNTFLLANKLLSFSVSSVQFSRSVVSDSLRPRESQLPGLPVHHQLPEFTQTHVHWVGDAIQPSHPMSSPSPPAPNPSQHLVFSNESTLRMRWPNYWSFSFSISPSNEHPGPGWWWTGWISLQCKGFTRVFSNTTVQKHQFFGVQLSSQSNSHIHTWPLKKP